MLYVQHAKVAEHLLAWTADARFADFIERAEMNGILGTQRGSEPGVMLYMLPLGAGVSKGGRSAWRQTNWGTPFDSFWCCYGTLAESFALLGSRAFFEGGSDLYVTGLTSANAAWEAAGLDVSV